MKTSCLFVLFFTLAFAALGQTTKHIEALSPPGRLAIGVQSNTAIVTGTTTVRQTIGFDPDAVDPIVDTEGQYFALIIGVQEYPDKGINPLNNPIKDAKSVYDMLTSRYTFSAQNTQLLSNPTKKQITSALEKYTTQLNKNDRLLIFYAGHGYWDEGFRQGYWFANDARKNDRDSWFPNSTLRGYIRAIPAKHTLLITDACFSGSIFKTRDAFSKATKAIKELERYPSRQAMTSGAMTTVPDESVFVKYFLQRLKENTKTHLAAFELFSSFRVAVMNNSPADQLPQFGVVKEADDEGGDFIFVKK